MMNIGLLGAVINSDNLGCLALTYSLVSMLEKIANENHTTFNYYIFEGTEENGGIDLLSESINVEATRINKIPVTYIYKTKTIIHHPVKARNVYSFLKKCDVFIDLTAGDSFTDIYGNERFFLTTRIKNLIEKKGVPLILGPQTYGPFINDDNKLLAKRSLEQAKCVISRDSLSAEYIKTFSDVPVTVTTDLAFNLPYKSKNIESDKIRVGFNISSLLVSNKTEDTKVNFSIKTDYDEYVFRVLEYLCSNDKYDVHIIPHVGQDGGNSFSSRFKNLTNIQSFKTPIEAKNYISQMDIFIGARMHATIGAFSSGVATIPNAYSRKFKGLYDNIEYPYIIDLQELNTDNAVELTFEYINKYKTLKKHASDVSFPLVEKLSTKTKNIISDCLKEIG